MVVEMMYVDCAVQYYGSDMVTIVYFDLEDGNTSKEMLYRNTLNGYVKLIADLIVKHSPSKIIFDTKMFGMEVKEAFDEHLNHHVYPFYIDSYGNVEIIA